MKKSIFALIAFVGFATSTFAGNDNTDKTKNTGTTCIQTIKLG